jgi:hypothetical protein
MTAPRLYISTITANLTLEYRALPKPHPGAVAYVPEGAGVRVKPLVWSEEDDALIWVAGDYRIAHNGWGFRVWRSAKIVADLCPAIEAAKAAAQADYEARIMAALEPMEPSDE